MSIFGYLPTYLIIIFLAYHTYVGTYLQYKITTNLIKLNIQGSTDKFSDHVWILMTKKVTF
jgi:hypothetical protein